MLSYSLEYSIDAAYVQELMFMAGERIVILMQLEKSNETEEDLLLGYCEGVVGLLK